MDCETLIAGMDFGRNRLNGILDAIEKAAPDLAAALAWRPGPGRAHIAWQAMHCAATHDKYVNVNLRAGQPTDAALVAAYGGGSKPSDQDIPTLTEIRSALEAHYRPFREYVRGLASAELGRTLPNGRTVGDSILLLTWHEAHHQGQIHLTWNLFKAAHGLG